MLRGPGCALIALGLSGCWAGSAVAAPKATWLGSYVWTEHSPRVAGLSGFDTDTAGTAFMAVGDIGTLVTGRLLRDADGRVRGVAADPLGILRDGDGRRLGGDRHDAEGLAILPEGGFAVSFEQIHRIVTYAGPGALPAEAGTGLDIGGLDWNGGYEALAAQSDGTLYALPERVGVLDATIPVRILQDGRWRRFATIPKDGFWRPVGADFGPDGRLYLLERDFWGFLGFMSRIRRFEMTSSGLAGGEVLYASTAGIHVNLEGIAAWQDAEGRTRLTMVSDNNLRAQQRTEFADFLVSE